MLDQKVFMLGLSLQPPVLNAVSALQPTELTQDLCSKIVEPTHRRPDNVHHHFSDTASPHQTIQVRIKFNKSTSVVDFWHRQTQAVIDDFLFQLIVQWNRFTNLL